MSNGMRGGWYTPTYYVECTVLRQHHLSDNISASDIKFSDTRYKKTETSDRAVWTTDRDKNKTDKQWTRLSWSRAMFVKTMQKLSYIITCYHVLFMGRLLGIKIKIINHIY